MKIAIESTEQIIEMITSSPTDDYTGQTIPARLWIGKTDSGIPVQVLVTRIAVANEERQEEFERELRAEPAPRPEVIAFPLRMLL